MEDVTFTDAPEVPEGGQTEEVKTTSTESGDPLDAISDPDKLREIAKGRGHAYDRVKNELDGIKTNPPATQQYVTKTDLLLTNTQEAQKRVPEEVRQNWKDIIDYVPTKYRSATTPDDIAKAMTIAHTAWKAENPTKGDANPGAELATDAGIAGGSQTVPPADTKPVNDPWAPPKGPDGWYGEKK